MASCAPSCVACLLADIDHFKAINDRLGYLEGDRVLRAAAEAISRSVRETDVVGRYGGEEFVVLLPHTDLAGALTSGEKIRAAVAERCAPVTISVDVAVRYIGSGFDNNIEDLVTNLLRDADRATYVAKAAGRNRVASTSERETINRHRG